MLGPQLVKLWEGLGRVALLEKCVTGAGFEVSKAHAQPPLSAYCLWIRCKFSIIDPAPYPPARSHAPHHDGHRLNLRNCAPPPKLFNESAWLWCLITTIEKQLRPPSWFLHPFYTLLHCFLNIMLSLTFLKNNGAFLHSETINHAQRSQNNQLPMLRQHLRILSALT